MPKLTTVGVKNAKDGKHSDGRGLWLYKRGESGSWIYRYTHLGKRREMSLGTYPALSLAQARQARDEWAAEAARGEDPIALRAAREAQERADRDRHDPTFADAVDIVFEAYRAKLRGGGSRGRWRSPLDIHVIPSMGKVRLSQLHQTDIVNALKPIWREKHPTAQKAIQRIGIVIDRSEAMGFQVAPLIVKMARHILGEVHHQVRHIEATPWREMPGLYQRLCKIDLVSSRALRWLMLTLVRSHAGRAAMLAEVEGDIWTVPADRIKGTMGKVRPFRVPLAGDTLAMVEEAREFGDAVLFPGHGGRALSSAALEKALTEMGEAGRPHGFRAAFRTWAEETQVCSREVAETILGHKVYGDVEASYQRSDLLDLRRPVHEAWSRFLLGEAADVIPIRGRG